MNKTLKKITAVFTSVMMLTSAIAVGTTSAAAEGTDYDVYRVVGRPADPIFGTDFDATNEDNDMTTTDGITYTKTYTVAQAYENIMLKVVKPAEEAADVIWYGDATGGNVTFDMTQAGDFTVTFDTATEEVSVTGDYVSFKTAMDYDTVIAVGNGEGAWLNGQAWQEGALVNEMTEIEDDVWQITYEHVPDGFDRQVKFAIDGGWTYNFGKPKDGLAPDFEAGEWFDAAWDGDNINFDTDDWCTVTATLDLTDFNFVTKTGAKYKIDIDYDTYRVVGRPADPIFGTDFDATNEDNDMETEDGIVFTKTYTVDQAYENIMLKVVKPAEEAADVIWYGDATGGNVTFDMTQAGDFTVTFNADTEEVTVTGDYVSFKTTMDYSTVIAVGNGEGAWLNGQAWQEGALVNEMTEIEDDVWQITYEHVPDGFDRQVKFAIDGGWTYNFGKPKDGQAPAFEAGTWFDAAWDGDNINFDTDDLCTVILTLDLTDFNFVTKTGAKYKIDIVSEAIIGDVDGDGEITVDDATLLLEYLAEYDVEIDESVADTNGDGKIDVRDVTEIQRYVAEIIDEF